MQSYRLLSTASPGPDGRVELSYNESVCRISTIRRLLSPEECQAVIQLSEQFPQSSGETGDQEVREREQIRKSTVRFVLPTPESEWLYARLEHALRQVNRIYRYALTGFFGGIQVATYEAGGHYDWHADMGSSRYYSARKLSMTVQLSDPADYDGGDLEFFPPSHSPTARDRGSMTVFPSFLVHRVSPVTRGERISLVSWVSGPSFS